MAMADAYPHHAGYPTDRLVGAAPAIAALRAQVRHLATFDTVGSPHIPTVLLQGETGTGKGLVARVIHDSGPRASGPFIEVNCAAIPETMLEAELFGFDPGAFTDTKRAKPGLFEAASGGTLFLDEIDALPLVLQGKLITALEAKRVRRLGAVTERGVDVKLIAATNAVLPEVVAAGRFRADLYHRLAVVVLGLPPLRDRGTDIVALAEAFVQHYTAAHGLPPKRLSSEAEAWLQGYAWPGNVRELSHVMERVTLLHIGEEVDAKTQYHQQIAQVVEEQFPEIAATQPEWLAHHYTAAGLGAQAIPYWQRAGQGAIRRSANLEAIRHLTTGLALLARLPETRCAPSRSSTCRSLWGQHWWLPRGMQPRSGADLCPSADAVCTGGRDAPTFPHAARFMSVLSDPWGVTDRARAGRTTRPAGAARSRIDAPPRSPRGARRCPLLPGRISRRPSTL
jgi:DNA-binding NtrC family response regulator